MLLYKGSKNPGYYCDNNIKLTDLYPSRIFNQSSSSSSEFLFEQVENYGIIAVGKGLLIINSTSVSCNLGAGQLIILPPHVSFSLRSAKDTDYCYLEFSGLHASDFDIYANLIHFVNFFYDEFLSALSREDAHDIYFVLLLFKLYAFLGAHNNLNAKKTMSRHVKMALDNINYSGYFHGYNLESLANDLGISSKYLSRLFKKEVGITMQEYLKNRRLEEGYKLLLQGCKVKDAAEKCGIKHVNNFSEMFYRRYGIRPSEVKSESY